ncbi:hypothetical protein DFO77_107110 [Marinilabilia salmonicolor]|jgi:hypothetical protein|uniref:Uncharacterized protein n=1 Tax=Marinilabilia salmonicolor TaxID=989 RepID=A0A368V6V3_9BACT|nr:hypothetical protein DFO77_107110 [Marinilabilia salmonicolor]
MYREKIFLLLAVLFLSVLPVEAESVRPEGIRKVLKRIVDWQI